MRANSNDMRAARNRSYFFERRSYGGLCFDKERKSDMIIAKELRTAESRYSDWTVFALMVGLVVDKVDKIMHGMVRPDAQPDQTMVPAWVRHCIDVVRYGLDDELLK
jgi:hypothetical protein